MSIMAAKLSVASGAAGGETEKAESLALEALAQLVTTSPPRYLSPSPELSLLARDASRNLFTSLIPFCHRKALPLDRLYADDKFDAEQIWQQIEFQSKPLARSVRRNLRELEKLGPLDLIEVFGGKVEEEVEQEEEDEGEEESGEEEEEEEDEEEEEEEEEDEEEEEEDEEEDEGEEKERGRLDDGFFDTKELEDFMEKEEEMEYGGKEEEKKVDVDDDEDEGDQFGEIDTDDEAEYATYEDFFGKKKTSFSGKGEKKVRQKTKSTALIEDEDGWEGDGNKEETLDRSLDMETYDEQMNESGGQNNGTLSTYEKQNQKIQSEIEKIEKELVAPKSWTMLGEVTASKRPKNSALEVDLDFQHNRGRPPLATEENTASVEELIIKRIREGHFDDVQRTVALPSKVPKQLTELDENKSQKGLAEIYEEDYARKAGLASAPILLSDEQKKEADLLFKKICFKLDALSHFHFTPKPVIEDMSIQANIPALAMEEIAPLAISDAAMLAPEEVFAGKGDIKEEAELTKEDRKRRRAKKKRKFKAESEKRLSKKARENTHLGDGKETS